MKLIPGLNVQAPWARLIVSGQKTIETRFYPIPTKYVGCDIALIETPGTSGKFKARIVGIVRFGAAVLYADAESFYQDSKRHLVQPTSPQVNWALGNGKPKWGWPILRVTKHEKPLPRSLRRGIVFTKSVPV